ncbi:MAG: hypothetical protein WEA10_08025 [Actinomycetota bacterium]
MGCLIVLLSLAVPRFVLLLLWLTGYMERAYDSFLWPLLGFFFLPLTTVAYAVAQNEFDGGASSAGGVILIVIALLIDLGSLGNGARSRRAQPAD